MSWRDAWWFSIWLAIFSIGVSAWVEAQTLQPGGIFADGFETGDTCAWTADGCTPPQVGVLSRDIRTISRTCVGPSTVRVENERCVTDEPAGRDVIGWDSGKRVQVCLPPSRSERLVWTGPARASDGCSREEG